MRCGAVQREVSCVWMRCGAACGQGLRTQRSMRMHFLLSVLFPLATHDSHRRYSHRRQSKLETTNYYIAHTHYYNNKLL